VRGALAYAFDELEIERVISICRVDHHRSERVMQRLNLSLQGTTSLEGAASPSGTRPIVKHGRRRERVSRRSGTA